MTEELRAGTDDEGEAHHHAAAGGLRHNELFVSATATEERIVGGDGGDADACSGGEVLHHLPAGGHRHSGPVVVAAA